MRTSCGVLSWAKPVCFLTTLALLMLPSLHSLAFEATQIPLDQIREAYAKAPKDKLINTQLLKQLTDLKQSSQYPGDAVHSAVITGYLGAAEAVWAAHAFNPMAKLKTFRSGTQKLEQAIGAQPELLELRYLRLSIQRNAPAFLGYNAEVEGDVSYLREHLNTIQSPILKELVLKILRQQSQ